MSESQPLRLTLEPQALALLERIASALERAYPPPQAAAQPGTASLPGMEPPPKKRRRNTRAEPEAPVMGPPERFEEKTLAGLERWARTEVPTEAAHVRHHVAVCLRHFRAQARPELRTMRGWILTAQNWIAKAPEMRARGATPPPPSRPQAPPTTAASEESRMRAQLEAEGQRLLTREEAGRQMQAIIDAMAARAKDRSS